MVCSHPTKRKLPNKFNHYFVNVADSLCKKIPPNNNRYQDFLKNPNKSSLFFQETTPHEISLIIHSMKSDIFGYSTKLVKIASPALVYTLSAIFNNSITEGIFPDAMKLAKMLPLHKAESRYVVSNYRAISLLPILSKVIEKLMYKRLIDFISKINILTPNQYGFQINRSNELALNAITNNIVNSFEKKNLPTVSSLTLPKLSILLIMRSC